MIHELKIDREYFDAIVRGDKKFEVRKDDRGYEVGHYLALNETKRTIPYNGSDYTGRSMLVKVTYIFDDDDYCKEGYVVMGIKQMTVVDGFGGSVMKILGKESVCSES